MDRKADPDGFLSRLKPLFKECVELHTVPVPYRGEIAQLMEIADFNSGAAVVTEGNVTPDLYIVLRGVLEAKPSKVGSFRHCILYKPFEAVGFVTPLTQIDWVTCTLRALEWTRLVTVARDQLMLFVERINHIKEKTELREFVIATVPGAKFLGMSGKEKVVSYFETEHFKKGDVLLKEGQISDYAYIIRRGECLKTTINTDRKPRRLSPLRSVSPSSPSSLVISLVVAKQWVGEECLIYDAPLDYSVVASSKVTALKIHRDNFAEKLPKETIQALQTQVDFKKEWKEQRQMRIKQAISQIALGASPSKSEPFSAGKKSASVLRVRRLDQSDPSTNQSLQDSFFLTDKQNHSASPLKSVKLLTRSWVKEGESIEKAAFFNERNPFATRTPSLKAVHIPRNPSSKSVRKSLSPMKSSLQSVREHFGYNARVFSPNPTALWIKKHNIDPSFLTSVQPAKEIPSALQGLSQALPK